MSHPDDLVLLQYRFDTLDGDEKGRVADHLRTCSDCTIRYANIGKSVEKLNAWNAENELAPGVVDSALERVRYHVGEAGPLGPQTAAPAASPEPVGAPPVSTSSPGSPPPPRAPTSIPLPQPLPPPPLEPFPGLAAWLGLKGGLPSSTARFALTAIMGVTLLGLGGGQLYWSSREPRVQTRVTAPMSVVSGDRALFSVDVSRADGKGPLSAAEVEVVLTDGATRTSLSKGTTNVLGHAGLSVQVPDDVPPGARFEVVSRALGEIDAVPQLVEVKRELKLHLSTDKPLYQPGQTIHVRSLVLRAPSLAPLAGGPMTIEVRDPKGNRLGQRELTLSRFGVGSFDFELADGIASGSYLVSAISGENKATVKVEVARYTLPRFSITLTPERDGYLAGETLQVRLLARTFFGKPVGKAKVRALLVRQGGAIAGQITALTSGDGDATFELPLPATLGAPGIPEPVRVQVEVTDTAGEMEAKQLGLAVGRELLAVEVIPAQRQLVAGVANDAFVLLTTPDGKPVAGEGTIDLDGERISFKTGINGVGAFSCTPKVGAGFVRAEVSVGDATGRHAALSLNLPKVSVPAFIGLDRALVVPGESVEATVRLTGAPAGWALELRREGHLIDRQQVAAHDAQGVYPVKLTVPAGITGALDVQLVSTDSVASMAVPPQELDRREYKRAPDMLRGAAVMRQALPTGVVAERRILAADPRGVSVTMSTDQSPYRPGATAKVRFAVKDAAGKPVAAAIGVAVVDESLFALTTARPSLARAFFLLGSSLELARGPLAASSLMTADTWTATEQAAAQVLFTAGYLGVTPIPDKASESLPAKLAVVATGRSHFADVADPGWTLWGALFGLVVIWSLSRYLTPWLGGAAFAALGVGVVVFLPFSGWLVAMMLFVGIGLIFALQGALGRFPWGLVVVPVVVALLSTTGAFQQRAIPPMSMRAPSDAMREERALAGAKTESKTVNELAQLPAPAPQAPQMLKAMKPMATGKGVAAALDMLSGSSRAEVEHREVRVRQYFPETLYVNPELVTDEEGNASLEIPIADSITNWRITALASTAGGKLGALEEPLKVFQDFFVDLDTPVALVVGDTATIPIAVHNYLGENQVVRLEVKPSPGFEVLGAKTFQVQVGAGEMVGQELKIRVLSAGKHALRVHADGTKLSDEIVKELRVFDAGEERSVSVSGTLKPGQKIPVAITLPPEAQPGSARLVARVFGSRVASAFTGLEGALAEPHGCFEQTSSTTYPNVLIWKHLLDSGHKDSPAIERARSYVALGYQRLLSYEVPGGGFEWFGRSPANQVLSAYGLLEFKDMAQVFPVDPQVITRTQNFLISRQQSDGSWEADRASLNDGLYRSSFSARLNISAYIAWALAESGFRGPPLERAARYLANNADQSNDPYTLALITGMLARAGHPQAQAMATKLAALARVDGELQSFTPAEATVYYSRGTGASAEATALAMQALGASRAGPETIRAALAWLAANRDGRGTWHSTQGTVMALRAILMGDGHETDQTVKVSVNGGAPILADVVASADHAASLDLATSVKRGDNVVTLEGTAEAPFQVVLTWVQPWREPGADDREALSLGVTFGRTKAKLGDVVPVDVKVTYRKPEASGMAVASLGVPAGLQVLPEDLELLRKQAKIARYEIGPGAVSLYFDRLTIGTPVTLGLRMKAVSKVSTKGQGSLAYLYYHPEVRAKAPATAVVVD